MTVTYVYCFSLLELSKSNKLIYDIIQYAYGYTFHKNIFFHNLLKNNAIFSQFSNKTTRFFHNFQKKRHDFFTIGLVPDPFTILEKKRWWVQWQVMGYWSGPQGCPLWALRGTG